MALKVPRYVSALCVASTLVSDVVVVSGIVCVTVVVVVASVVVLSVVDIVCSTVGSVVVNFVTDVVVVCVALDVVVYVVVVRADVDVVVCSVVVVTTSTISSILGWISTEPTSALHPYNSKVNIIWIIINAFIKTTSISHMNPRARTTHNTCRFPL